jgi:hypothetical protein
LFSLVHHLVGTQFSTHRAGTMLICRFFCRSSALSSKSGVKSGVKSEFILLFPIEFLINACIVLTGTDIGINPGFDPFSYGKRDTVEMAIVMADDCSSKSNSIS